MSCAKPAEPTNSTAPPGAGRATTTQIKAAPKRSEHHLGQRIAGIAAIYAFEKAVARGLTKAGLKIPSSLTAMLLWLGGLKAMEQLGRKRWSDTIAKALGPAVEFLGKWMVLYLTPPLVMLPVAIKKNAAGTPASAWRRLLAIHAGGWALSCTLAGFLAHLLKNNRRPVGAAPTKGKPATAAASATPLTPLESRTLEPNAKPATTELATTPPVPPLFQQPLDPALKCWGKLAIVFYGANRTLGNQPAAFATTVGSLIAAQKLIPPAAAKVAHPIVVSAAATAISLVIVAKHQGRPWDDVFHSYVRGVSPVAGGAGDTLTALMNASVSCLGLRMYEAWPVLEENWRPLAGGASAAAVFSLFATSWAAGQARLPEELGLVLSQRSVMSALGMDGAKLLGASPSLAVASILLTGVYGASLGGKLLDLLGLPQPTKGGASNYVARGVAMGASAHAIGTASLLGKEPQAVPISSVSLCVTGVVHTVLMSLPWTQNTIKRLVNAS